MWDKNILIDLPVSVYIYANIMTFALLDLHSTEYIFLSYFCYFVDSVDRMKRFADILIIIFSSGPHNLDLYYRWELNISW